LLPKDVLLSNGRFAVTLDENAQIRDFYFPYLGLENHAVGHPFRFGVWLDGKFEWLKDAWTITMTYMPETLTSRYLIQNQLKDIKMEVNDAIYHTKDIFMRKIKIDNKQDRTRSIRIFFTHDFHIYGYEAGDTAFFDPQLDAVIHYKGKRYFLIGGTGAGRGFHQYAIGYKEVESHEGTWRDCEDGQLEGNAVAQGAVDSAVSFKVEIPANGYGIMHYWIACGKSLDEITTLDSIIKQVGVEQMLLEVENYWSAWLSRLNIDLNVLPKNIARLYKRSLLLMRAHVDSNGGFLASLDSDIIGIHRDTYSYIWPRDGAMAALAFTSAGFTDVSERFLSFCHKVIGADGYFRHKYLPDGSLGSTWHALIDSSGKVQLPIQEDETASVLYSLWKCFENAGDIEFVTKVYDRLVVNAANFMMNYRDPKTHLPQATFDEWEEKVGVFTSTVAGVCAALDAAAKFAKVFYDHAKQEILTQAYEETKEALIKYLYDPEQKTFIKGILANGEKDYTIDSSISTVFVFKVLDPNDFRVKNTMETLEKSLQVKTEIGGVARYGNDRFRRVSLETPGNPWFIATLRIARWRIAKATSIEELSSALELLKWTARNALPSGALAEQLDPYTGKPLSATPLLWSHAEYVLSVTEYISKHQEITMAQPIQT
jgi:GH15 family glucan-1,4-alpha-glucosidase